MIATTLQAISGAGYPGVPSMDIIGNVVPFIGGEEEKMQQETQKILGDFAGDHIEPLAAKVSAHCNRVPVVDGHTVTRLGRVLDASPREADLRNAFETFPRRAAGAQSAQRARRIPCSIWTSRTVRSRARMWSASAAWPSSSAACAPCPVFDYKFVALGHNTIRGAAGAAVLNAELMHSEGLLD